MADGSQWLAKLAIFVGLILSVVFHEVSHGAAADAQGDPTPRTYGRLSLNPLKHLDPVGTIFMVLIVFLGVPFIGWAKPVPINPAFFRNYRKGVIITALAGPFANLSLLILSLFVVYIFSAQNVDASLFVVGFFGILVLINYVLMIFNLLPIPPLDGSRVVSMFLPWRLMVRYNALTQVGILFILFLVLFDDRIHIIGSTFHFAFLVLFSGIGLLFGSEFSLYVEKAVASLLG